MSGSILTGNRLSDDEHDKPKKSWADKVYYSSHQSGRKRGASILIHKQVNFTPTLIHKDTEGRYILVNGLIDGTEVSPCDPKSSQVKSGLIVI